MHRANPPRGRPRRFPVAGCALVLAASALMPRPAEAEPPPPLMPPAAIIVPLPEPPDPPEMALFTGSIPRSAALAPAADAATLATLRGALAAYRAGRLAEGDALAAHLPPGGARRAAAHGALRFHGRHGGLARWEAFLAEALHSGLAPWTEARIEDALAHGALPPEATLARLETLSRRGPAGDAAEALALQAIGRGAEAMAPLRRAWASPGLSAPLERRLLAAFSPVLGEHDRLERLQRLALAGDAAGARRLIPLAGPGAAPLAAAIAFGHGRGQETAPLDAVPAALRSTPGYRWAELQRLRRAGAIDRLVERWREAPRGEAALDPDAWWGARRLAARRLLDEGRSEDAYRIVIEQRGGSAQTRTDAALHAAWLALAALDRPAAAAQHALEARRSAGTPRGRAMASYWLGRARSLGAAGDARAAWEEALAEGTTYGGLLAALALGRQGHGLRVTAATLADRRALAEHPDMAALSALLAIGEEELARPIAHALARSLPTPGQVAALGDWLEDRATPALVLQVGRLAVERGLPVEQHAFPLSGVPPFEALDPSIERALTLAIARQESGFDPRAVSHANARGLMQMLPSTAARTARRFGQSFRLPRLTEEPAFSAALGSAHVGELLEETGGLLAVALAAYNAGGPRVKEWIARYGDPRRGAIDPVLWIERIPFTETRHYVKAVLEGLQGYRARLNAGESPLQLARDLGAAEAPP